MKSVRRLAAIVLLATCLGTRAAETAVPPALRLSSPLDFQVVQRSSRDEGRLTLSGSVAKPDTAAIMIQVRLLGAPGRNRWDDLATIPAGQTDFHGTWTVPSGGWYRLEARAFRVDGDPATAATATVEHVGVGEIFVIAGQSNAANHGEEHQKVTSGKVVTFTGTAWVPSHDPQPGASGSGGSFVPPFGDALAERFRVPIGIVAVAVGATSVREWLPRGTRFPNPPTLVGNVTQISPTAWESRGLLFDRLTQRMAALGPRGFRAVLWHQGESDANQKDPTRTLPGNRYRESMEILVRQSSRAIAWNPPWFVAQASYHTPDDPGSPDLRAAQKALWTSGVALEGPDTDALTGRFRDAAGQGVHFSGPGLKEHARLWAEKVSAWLETASPPSTR